MTSQIQALIGTWAMAAVGLLNAFVPGINDLQQTALTAFAGLTVTLAIAIFNKSASDTIDKDPAADFERARYRLARHSGIIMPGLDDPGAAAVGSGSAASMAPPAIPESVAREGWPPPQNNS